MFTLTQKQAIAIFSGKDPWAKKQVIRQDAIVHQTDIEIDGVPVAVVVFVAGKCGSDPIYNVGVGFVADGEYHERVKHLGGQQNLQRAIASCEKLAGNTDDILLMFA